LAVAPSGAVDQNRLQRAASGGGGCQGEHGRVADERAFWPAKDAAPHDETAAADRLRLALEADRGRFRPQHKPREWRPRVWPPRKPWEVVSDW